MTPDEVLDEAERLYHCSNSNYDQAKANADKADELLDRAVKKLRRARATAIVSILGAIVQINIVVYDIWKYKS